jgi:hypothetical protein
MPSSCLKDKERGQQVLSVCLVRIFTGVWHVGDNVFHNMA